jgi:hypothetical protein
MPDWTVKGMAISRYRLLGWLALSFALFANPVVTAAQEAAGPPRLGGIGVGLGMQGVDVPYPSVMEVSPGGAAARSGIGIGDRLIGFVDETGQFVDFQGKSLGEVAALVRGPGGSTLRLVLETKGSDERKLHELIRDQPAADSSAAPQKAVQAPAPAATPGTVRVEFFRESGFVGSLLNYRIEHNGRAIGNLGNGTYFSYDSPPGQQSFGALGNFGRGGTFTFEAGQTYYIELSVVPFSASLRLVNKERGDGAIRSMR